MVCPYFDTYSDIIFWRSFQPAAKRKAVPGFVEDSAFVVFWLRLAFVFVRCFFVKLKSCSKEVNGFPRVVEHVVPLQLPRLPCVLSWQIHIHAHLIYHVYMVPCSVLLPPPPPIWYGPPGPPPRPGTPSPRILAPTVPPPPRPPELAPRHPGTPTPRTSQPATNHKPTLNEP